MKILDGKALSTKIRSNVQQEVVELQKENITPGLAVVLVGSDPASAAYVNMKSKACKEAGLYSIVHEMPSTISQVSPTPTHFLGLSTLNSYNDVITDKTDESS